MRNLRAIIVHRHPLLRDLMREALRDAAQIEQAEAASHVDDALVMLQRGDANALAIEAAADHSGLRAALEIFRRGAAITPDFTLIAVSLHGSRIDLFAGPTAQPPREPLRMRRVEVAP